MAIESTTGLASSENRAITIEPKIEKKTEKQAGNTIDVRALTKHMSDSEDIKGRSDKDEEKEGLMSENTVKNAVSQANQQLRKHQSTRCEFNYHKATNRVSIRVVDKDTEEILREYPPEKSLDMLQKMWELAGILIDEKG